MGVPGSGVRLERVDESLTIVALEGEHDLSTAPALRDALRGLAEEGAAIVIDLGPATFVDSSILAVLIDARQQADDDGRGFSVALPASADAGVRRIIEITSLGDLLILRPDRDQAVKAAQSGVVAGQEN